MTAEIEEVRVVSPGRLQRVLGLIGIVAGVVGLVVGTALLGAHLVFVLPGLIQAAAAGREVNPSILDSFLFSILIILRAVLLLPAARAILKEKSTASKWAYVYGGVALVTVPFDQYLLYTSGSMAISDPAVAVAYALVRLLIPLGFLAFAISKTRQDRTAQEETTT